MLIPKKYSKTIPEEDTANRPLAAQEEYNSNVKEKHCHWIIEQAEDENGVYAVRDSTHSHDCQGRKLRSSK
jgi:hypothetical protein